MLVKRILQAVYAVWATAAVGVGLANAGMSPGVVAAGAAATCLACIVGTYVAYRFFSRQRLDE